MFKPYQSFDDDRTFYRERAVPPDADDQYKQNSLRSIQEEFGRELFEILMRCKSPAMVSINTEIRESKPRMGLFFYDDYYDFDKIVVSARITPIRFQQDAVPEYSKLDFSFPLAVYKPETLWQKIKGVFNKHG